MIDRHVRDITERPLASYNPPYGVAIDVTYGPVNCRNLRQDPVNAHKAIYNADSYAIAAVVCYISRSFSTWFPPFSLPPFNCSASYYHVYYTNDVL